MRMVLQRPGPADPAHMTFQISCLEALRVSAKGSLLFSCNMPAEGHELDSMHEHHCGSDSLRAADLE